MQYVYTCMRKFTFTCVAWCFLNFRLCAFNNNGILGTWTDLFTCGHLETIDCKSTEYTMFVTSLLSLFGYALTWRSAVT